jgi:hypothetical protein
MPVPTDAWVKIGAATSPVFSKDGCTLFHLRGAGLPQVWAMDVNGGGRSRLKLRDSAARNGSRRASQRNAATAIHQPQRARRREQPSHTRG